jgi:lysyl-tRNA synthetase class 1
MQYREWPFIEADKIISRLREEGRDHALFETGYGPSGLPHIGTFGEVARTTFVRNALKLLAPHIKSTLVAFSDDMDALRSVPENVPGQAMLKDMLGRPLNAIPDPYGECASFSDHMNQRLQRFLSSFGFDFTFMASSDVYRSGRFNRGLTEIMRHHKEVIEIFTAMIAEDKRTKWSPFFPICESCGKMSTTLVTEHHIDVNEVSYVCSSTENPSVMPCGYSGRTSILDGKAKVGWKIDWALRWFMLGVDYEMYGKDLIDSVSISTPVVRVLGAKEPILYKYELFLDEHGAKISKKRGNGVSMEEWLRYASRDVLLHALYVRPNQAKKMALSLIPKAVDDYRQVLKDYRGEMDAPLSLLKPEELLAGTAERLASDVDYVLILNLVANLNATDRDFVMTYLLRYDPRIAQQRGFFEDMVDKAILFNQEVMSRSRREPQIDGRFDPFLLVLKDRLLDASRGGKATSDEIQTICFGIARENSVAVGDWFKYLYQVLLAQERGPKMGAFICLLGIDATIAKMDSYLGAKKDNDNRTTA